MAITESVLKHLKSKRKASSDGQDKQIGSGKERKPLSDKRIAQHIQWMKVMMEGQATPDNRFRLSY